MIAHVRHDLEQAQDLGLYPEPREHRRFGRAGGRLPDLTHLDHLAHLGHLNGWFG